MKLVTAMTIAGSDSGGGAGLQADLKTFASLGVHGTSVTTCITAQNPRQVAAVQPVKSEVVRQQLAAVFAELPPKAIKTGMLYSSSIIRTVAGFLSQLKSRPPLIVDPVMVATSGARLLNPGAIRAFQKQLLPLTTLLTPNVDEAQVLTGQAIRSRADLTTAARALHELHGCAVLVKGGHLRRLKAAVDVYWDADGDMELESPFTRNVSTHGTGCTLSAAIAGYLALGCDLPQAVQLGKQYISQAIAQSHQIGRHSVLNHFWEDLGKT